MKKPKENKAIFAKKIICIIFAFIVISGCSALDKQYQKEIQGKWNVYGSEMNNKPNSFMKDGWFEFLPDGKVNSNLFANTQNYKIENKVLNIDTPEKFSLNIAKLENDSMLIEGKIKYYFMKYYMAKAKD